MKKRNFLSVSAGTRPPGITVKHLFYCFYGSQCALFGKQLCKQHEVHIKAFKATGGLLTPSFLTRSSKTIIYHSK